MRNGNWMQTFTGKKFFPIDPRVEEIHIEDIAHALSNLCRFGGHSKKFYSVAEHCYHISHKVPKEYALWGLLHDASEAYIGDMILPLKEQIEKYKEVEYELMKMLVKKFNLTPRIIPDSVKNADICILNDEHKQVMGGCLDWWHDSKIALEVNIKFWKPSKAKYWFIKRYYEIKKKK